MTTQQKSNNPYSTDRVFIRSVGNPEQALSVTAATASSPVKLSYVHPTNWNSPLSQWVMTEVAQSIYQISLFASSGSLLLEASAATATSPLNIAALSVNETQLWKLNEVAEKQYCLESLGAPGLEVGFAGDYPVDGLSLTMNTGRDQHHKGDNFTVTLVGQSVKSQ